MDLVLTNSLDEVRRLVAAGYCPVECSIGEASVVDELEMDHHGDHSALEPVALRAYRDHFGARASDPRFVTVGVADADCCFATAALAGLLPHPQRPVAETIPPPVRASLTRDLTDLARVVSRVDVSPIGLDIPAITGGDYLLTWNAMTAAARDSLGYQAGVGLWRSLTEGNPVQIGPFLAAAKEAEISRRAAALADLEERGAEIDGVLVIRGSRVFGFDVWYGRIEAEPLTSPAGWRYPVVVAHLERGGNVTLGCPNDQVARALFGEGGLRGVFPHLRPTGWGGHDAVGGSPRGVVLTAEEADEAARTVAVLRR